MAASTSPPIAQLLPAERFFRVSLFLLLFTAILTLIGTGKIDLFTSLIATAAAGLMAIAAPAFASQIVMGPDGQYYRLVPVRGPAPG